MTLDLRRLIDRAGRWLLNYRPQPLAVGAEINRFAEKVAELTPRMSEWLRGDDRAIVEKEVGRVRRARCARGPRVHGRRPGLYQYSLLDVIDIADIVDREPAEVADTYFALMDHLGTDGLLTAVSGPAARRPLAFVGAVGDSRRHLRFAAVAVLRCAGRRRARGDAARRRSRSGS